MEIRERPRLLRRLVLASLALAGLSASLGSGCSAGFDSISKINALRVLAVVADRCPSDQPTCDARERVGASYAGPGDEVTFTLSHYDGFVDPDDPGAGSRNLQILWIGGCFDPDGDQYFACYPQLAQIFQDLDPANPLASGFIGVGDTFTMKLPDDIVSRRPRPAEGPYYGIAYVFFAVCAGTIAPIPPEDGGLAGSFPLGCIGADGKRLGADGFVPGYTQIYVFDDGRTNENPRWKGLTLDGVHLAAGFDEPKRVKACGVGEDARRMPPGCGRPDPYSDCTSYTIDVAVPEDVAEVDPDGVTPEGKHLHEAVWVDYFAEKGDLDTEVRLVSDATTLITPGHSTRWVPPPEPGYVSLWAVLHDARGGEAVIQRWVEVTTDDDAGTSDAAR
jgi:hypothetical protein